MVTPFFEAMTEPYGELRKICMTDPGLQRGMRAVFGAVAALAGAVVLLAASVTSADAQRIENGTAVFAALDKVTARISRLEVKLGETVRFGALKLTPRACYSRSPTEPPKTTSFVEVQEILLDGTEQRLFNGWMFAESPGLSAVEHPVFDVWLTECATPLRGVAQRAPSPAGPAGARPPAAGAQQPPSTEGEAAEPLRRRRPPR